MKKTVFYKHTKNRLIYILKQIKYLLTNIYNNNSLKKIQTIQNLIYPK